MSRPLGFYNKEVACFHDWAYGFWLERSNTKSKIQIFHSVHDTTIHLNRSGLGPINPDSSIHWSNRSVRSEFNNYGTRDRCQFLKLVVLKLEINRHALILIWKSNVIKRGCLALSVLVGGSIETSPYRHQSWLSSIRARKSRTVHRSSSLKM